MAVITVHHWNDVATGLAEMVRVARRRVVVLTFDPAPIEDLWIIRDYFPGAFDNHAAVMPPVGELAAMLPGAEIATVPTRARCADGFFIALWDRPELLLDPNVRRASSSMHQIPPEEVERGVAKLSADLESAAGTNATAISASCPSSTSACACLLPSLRSNSGKVRLEPTAVLESFSASIERSTASMKLCVCPLADFLDQADHRLTVKRLGIQDFVVTQGYRVLG